MFWIFTFDINSGSIGIIYPILSTTFTNTHLLFFFQKAMPLLSAERRTPWSVRAFREGDYADGITHGIGATLSFRLLLVIVAFPVRLKLKMFHAQM